MAKNLLFFFWIKTDVNPYIDVTMVGVLEKFREMKGGNCLLILAMFCLGLCIVGVEGDHFHV